MNCPKESGLIPIWNGEDLVCHDYGPGGVLASGLQALEARLHYRGAVIPKHMYDTDVLRYF